MLCYNGFRHKRRRLSVLISLVISRSLDLRRCELSHVMSSAFCLKLVSFLGPLHLGSLSACSAVGVRTSQLGISYRRGPLAISIRLPLPTCGPVTAPRTATCGPRPGRTSGYLTSSVITLDRSDLRRPRGCRLRSPVLLGPCGEQSCRRKPQWRTPAPN
jgi:hypothetical protein